MSNRFNFQSAACLRSLTPTQFTEYLHSSGSDFTSLESLIAQDSAIQELAQSPLMLNIMTLAFQGVTFEDLPATTLKEERRQQLFNAYIERMFKRRRVNLYSQAQTMRWLAWLAKKCSGNLKQYF